MHVEGRRFESYWLHHLIIYWRNFENFRIGNLNSEYYIVYSGQLVILKKDDLIYWKYSKILEPWIEIYNIEKNHIGTIPVEVFKREFKTNLI